MLSLSRGRVVTLTSQITVSISVDWNSLLAAFIGGIFGSGISGMVAVMQFRRAGVHALQERRWLDAEVVADAQTLLMDLDPTRRTINVNTDRSVEAKLWEDLNRRRDELYRQLLLLAAGHPSQEVEEAARELSTALLLTAQYSLFAVTQVYGLITSPGLIEEARDKHAMAEKAAAKLVAAVKSATAPARRGRVRQLFKRE